MKRVKLCTGIPDVVTAVAMTIVFNLTRKNGDFPLDPHYEEKGRASF